MTDLTHDHDVPRRSFVVRAMTAFVAGIVGAVPLLAGAGFLLDPLWRKRRASTDKDAATAGFLPLTIGPDALPADGTPQAVTVFADHVDAWNFYPQQPVGSVWLRKSASGELIAFSTICPHLGCSVDFRSAKQDFFCPCHLSSFNLDGDRQNQIPPRNMDQLELKVVEGKIWVNYQNFRSGVSDRTPV